MKILHTDIETYPNKAYVWGLWKQNIAINQIVEAGYTACWAAKWHGSDEIFFDAEWRNKNFIKEIHTLLDEADVVVHYNGKKFDIPMLNREFITHDLPPPAPYKEIDLLQVARKFRFPSKKLDYVAQELNIGQKVQHAGMPLWTGCMAGDKDSQKIMEVYNLEDVELLERLYEKLLPWITQHPNHGLFTDGSDHVCPNCGSHNIVKRGYRDTRVGRYQRYRCNGCGAWSSDGKRIGKTEVR